MAMELKVALVTCVAFGKAVRAWHRGYPRPSGRGGDGTQIFPRFQNTIS